MRKFLACLIVNVALVTSVLAAETPPPAYGTPRIHTSVCELATSMASRFGNAKLDHERAEEACQTLAPRLDAAGHAEFMRCCVKQFEQR